MKDIIEMAREAGFQNDPDGCFWVADRDGDCTEELKAFEALVRADAIAEERERIFQELLRMHENTKGAHNYFLHAVGTIRARSNI